MATDQLPDAQFGPKLPKQRQILSPALRCRSRSASIHRCRPLSAPFFQRPISSSRPHAAFHALHLSFALTSLGLLHLSENSKNRRKKTKSVAYSCPFQVSQVSLDRVVIQRCTPHPPFSLFPFSLFSLSDEAARGRTAHSPGHSTSQACIEHTHEPSASAGGPLTLAYRPRSLRSTSLSPLSWARIAFSSCGSKSRLSAAASAAAASAAILDPCHFTAPMGSTFSRFFWVAAGC
jgi:hypothetical protein